MTGPTDRARILLKARQRGIFTTREVMRWGIHTQALSRLTREGLLERVARGQYRMPDQPVTENHALVIATRAAPQGVICLLTALRFHEIGTQLPFEVWIALDRHARRPALRGILPRQ